ncbi:hypothetical protein COCC4DRAFT_74335 [Bipolaris maydis ATCC 48331]|uniref:Uncharacterized protein n=1 Tax=Cochliobolus heterostrophus (strain C4 / ATCC 48331 / race T) TaxID=665024 RepID=N4WNZ3_COCH4|nr:uncharacterized protein COCC4DRAFT_74335 [Bipolaris maydis ATCC 48331]ENI02169.1 hypothetical protein COCC4DRAFT_74335 [Bipolaris maydis ATCC 48331]
MEFQRNCSFGGIPVFSFSRLQGLSIDGQCHVLCTTAYFARFPLTEMDLLLRLLLLFLLFRFSEYPTATMPFTVGPATAYGIFLYFTWA